jgi:hypothetical protein
MKIGKRSSLGTGALVLMIVAASAMLRSASVAAQSGNSVAGAPQVSEVSPRSSPALNVPRTIYLMRHAEKPPASNDLIYPPREWRELKNFLDISRVCSPMPVSRLYLCDKGVQKQQPAR